MYPRTYAYIIPALLGTMCCVTIVASLCFMDNPIHHFKFLNWNVRGLNSQAKQEDHRQIVSSFEPDLVCI
jgi:hypothetical protein